jgi:hypothetical protein
MFSQQRTLNCRPRAVARRSRSPSCDSRVATRLSLAAHHDPQPPASEGSRMSTIPIATYTTQLSSRIFLFFILILSDDKEVRQRRSKSSPYLSYKCCVRTSTARTGRVERVKLCASDDSYSLRPCLLDSRRHSSSIHVGADKSDKHRRARMA